LTKIGAGELDFDGNSPNTFSGDMFVNQGTLDLLKSDGVVSVSGNLTIGTKSSLLNDNGTSAIAGTNVTVNGGS
jgi:autotransporter-associated beta strand protein